MVDLISQRTTLVQENTQLQQEAGAIEQQRMVLAAQKASIEAQNTLIAQRAADAQKAQAQLAVIQRMGGNVALYEPGVRLSESKLQEATKGQGEAVSQYNLAGQQLNTRIEVYNSMLNEYGSQVERFNRNIEAYNQEQQAKAKAEYDLAIAKQAEFSSYLGKVAEGTESVATARLYQRISGDVLYTGGTADVSDRYSERERSLGGESRPELLERIKAEEIAGSRRYLGATGGEDIVFVNDVLFQESAFTPEQISIANQVFSGRMSALAAYERERELEQDRLKTGMLIGGTATFAQPASYIEAYKAIIGNAPTAAQVNVTPYVWSEEQLRARAIILSSPTAQFGSGDIYASEYAKIKERTAYPIEPIGIKKIDFAPAIEKDETGQIKFYGVEGSLGVQISKQANEARLATINVASIGVVPAPIPDTARLPGWGVMTPQAYAEKYNLPFAFQGTEQQKQQYAEKWWGELPASQKIKVGVTTVASNFFSRPMDVVLAGGDFSKVKPFETLAYETVAGEGAAYREAGDSYWGGLGKSFMGNELLITGVTAYGFGVGIGLVSRIPTVGAPIATATGIGAVSYGVGDIGYKAYTGDVRGAMIEGTAFIASAPLAMAGFKGVGGKAVSISALVPKIELAGKYEVRGGLTVDTAGMRGFASDVGQILGKTGVDTAKFFGEVTGVSPVASVLAKTSVQTGRFFYDITGAAVTKASVAIGKPLATIGEMGQVISKSGLQTYQFFATELPALKSYTIAGIKGRIEPIGAKVGEMGEIIYTSGVQTYGYFRDVGAGASLRLRQQIQIPSAYVSDMFSVTKGVLSKTAMDTALFWKNAGLDASSYVIRPLQSASLYLGANIGRGVSLAEGYGAKYITRPLRFTSDVLGRTATQTYDYWGSVGTGIRGYTARMGEKYVIYPTEFVSDVVGKSMRQTADFWMGEGTRFKDYAVLQGMRPIRYASEVGGILSESGRRTNMFFKEGAIGIKNYATFQIMRPIWYAEELIPSRKFITDVLSKSMKQIRQFWGDVGYDIYGRGLKSTQPYRDPFIAVGKAGLETARFFKDVSPIKYEPIWVVEKATGRVVYPRLDKSGIDLMRSYYEDIIAKERWQDYEDSLQAGRYDLIEKTYPAPKPRPSAERVVDLSKELVPPHPDLIPEEWYGKSSGWSPEYTRISIGKQFTRVTHRPEYAPYFDKRYVDTEGVFSTRDIEAKLKGTAKQERPEIPEEWYGRSSGWSPEQTRVFFGDKYSKVAIGKKTQIDLSVPEKARDVWSVDELMQEAGLGHRGKRFIIDERGIREVGKEPYTKPEQEPIEKVLEIPKDWMKRRAWSAEELQKEAGRGAIGKKIVIDEKGIRLEEAKASEIPATMRQKRVVKSYAKKWDKASDVIRLSPEAARELGFRGGQKQIVIQKQEAKPAVVKPKVEYKTTTAQIKEAEQVSKTRRKARTAQYPLFFPALIEGMEYDYNQVYPQEAGLKLAPRTREAFDTKPAVVVATTAKERQRERQRQQQFNTAMLRTDTGQAYRGAQKYQPTQLSRLQPLEKLVPIEAVVGVQKARTMQKTSPALKAMQESVSKLKTPAFASSKRKVKAGRGFYAYKEHAKIATPSQILQGMMRKR